MKVQRFYVAERMTGLKRCVAIFADKDYAVGDETPSGYKIVSGKLGKAHAERMARKYNAVREVMES